MWDWILTFYVSLFTRICNTYVLHIWVINKSGVGLGLKLLKSWHQYSSIKHVHKYFISRKKKILKTFYRGISCALSSHLIHVTWCWSIKKLKTNIFRCKKNWTWKVFSLFITRTFVSTFQSCWEWSSYTMPRWKIFF